MQLTTYIFAILILFGCTIEQPTSIPSTTEPITTPAESPIEPSAQPAIMQPCPELRTSAGELLYAKEDAASQFGGSWEEKKPYEKLCIYSFSSGNKSISIQAVKSEVFDMLAKASAREESGFNFKQLEGIGDGAILQWVENKVKPAQDPYAIFYIKKNERAIAILCAKTILEGCTEQEFSSIAQTIVKRI